MEFEDRLQKAIERGQNRQERREQQDRVRELGEEELKRLHTQYRLQLSEHIESCIKRLPQHFPGFQFQTIFGERGWGAACSRDDIQMQAGKRNNDYSRLELTVRPFADYHVVELASKGTIRNKEVFNRTYFEKITETDAAKFMELIDVWVLEYAELYAAKD